MKLNTSLIICVFFSAIIAIKAADDYEEYEIDDTPEEYPLAEEDQQEIQVEGYDNLEELPQEAVEFQYKPSMRLEKMEENLPNDAKKFVPEGKVKEVITNTFKNAMTTNQAKRGLAEAQEQWQLMLNGSEASRVIGTTGQNLKKIFTSPNGADMINMLVTTIHVLLTKGSEEKIGSGITNLISMTYALLTSDLMPDIVNKTGGLIITAVNKPRAPLFCKTYWNEVEKLLKDKKLNQKLNKYFTNTMSMMTSLSGIQNGKQNQSRVLA
ncbi:uncharacterized protein LOC112596791 [Melanaphis sacchari]|uniref:uncharacterized protein LOC112596791 n=1 Tax=Melanaphis sacchari TaxID=742174 RepID=UPI000DC150DC|nr:uncharacterized protein LOC112596791 [Melanaphis sacchari]